MGRMSVLILFLLFILIGPNIAHAVPFVQIQGNFDSPQTPSASDIGGTYGDFLIALGGTVTATPGPSLNTLTLSNTTITNNGVGTATLSIIYSNLFSPVDTSAMSAMRFYGTSMSGGFARGLFELAAGDSITLNASVIYLTSGEFPRTGSGPIDSNKMFDVTMANNNGFAPQNPPQGSANFRCPIVLDSTCAMQETLRTELSIVLGPADSLSLLGTITTLAATDQDSLDRALFDLARVPAPPTLLLFGSGLAVPALRWMRRKGLFRKGSLSTGA